MNFSSRQKTIESKLWLQNFLLTADWKSELLAIQHLSTREKLSIHSLKLNRFFYYITYALCVSMRHLHKIYFFHHSTQSSQVIYKIIMFHWIFAYIINMFGDCELLLLQRSDKLRNFEQMIFFISYREQFVRYTLWDLYFYELDF